MFFSLSRASALMATCPPRRIVHDHEANDSGDDIVAHWLVPVKPTPVTPVPAATLVLLRDRSHGASDVLLIRRHSASKFAAGDFVFPGGKIEVSDGPADAAGWCRGVDASLAARVLDLETAPHAALGHWVGVIRETFDGAASTAAALDRVRGRQVRTILPRVIMEGDQRRVLLPGEPGYY